MQGGTGSLFLRLSQDGHKDLKACERTVSRARSETDSCASASLLSLLTEVERLHADSLQSILPQVFGPEGTGQFCAALRHFIRWVHPQARSPRRACDPPSRLPKRQHHSLEGSPATRNLEPRPELSRAAPPRSRSRWPTATRPPPGPCTTTRTSPSSPCRSGVAAPARRWRRPGRRAWAGQPRALGASSRRRDGARDAAVHPHDQPSRGQLLRQGIFS